MADFEHFWESWKNNEETSISSVKDDKPVPEINLSSFWVNSSSAVYIPCQLGSLHILMDNSNVKMRVS